jgi:predicted metal-binding membrane protein
MTVRTRRALRRHPEYGALLAAAAAWPAVLLLHDDGAVATGAGGLPLWALMCTAMMVPATWPAVRHVGLNSLRRRRQRAIAQFVAAYVAVWVAFGLPALLAVAVAGDRLGGDAVLAAALGIAAAWSVLPYQRRALRACHRTVPLPASGWLATAGCVRFGLRQGRACLGVCWPLMLVMAAAVHESLLWMMALSAIVASRKLAPRSERFARPLAAAMGAVAVLLLAGPVGPVHAEHATHGTVAARLEQPPAAPAWLCREPTVSARARPRAARPRVRAGSSARSGRG